MMENIQTLANGVTIYWQEVVIQPAPRAKQPNRVDTYVYVSCPGCNEKRLVRKHNALSARLCRPCQAGEAGSIGYRSLIRRYGKAEAQKRILANCNPESWAETLVAEWLERDGFIFKPHVIFDTNPADDAAPWFVPDFTLYGGKGAIQVNGWGHNLPYIQKRDANFAKHWPGKLLVVTTDELRTDPKAARKKIREFCLDVHFDAWLSMGESHDQ